MKVGMSEGYFPRRTAGVSCLRICTFFILVTVCNGVENHREMLSLPEKKPARQGMECPGCEPLIPRVIGGRVLSNTLELRGDFEMDDRDEARKQGQAVQVLGRRLLDATSSSSSSSSSNVACPAPYAGTRIDSVDCSVCTCRRFGTQCGQTCNMFSHCWANGRCGRNHTCLCFDGWFGSNCDISQDVRDGFFVLPSSPVHARTSEGVISVPVTIVGKALVANITTLNVNSVTWTVSNGTALAGLDFLKTAGVVVMERRVTVVNVLIPLVYPYMYPKPVNMTLLLGHPPLTAGYVGPSVAPWPRSQVSVIIAEDRKPVIVSCAQTAAYSGLDVITVSLRRSTDWLGHAVRVSWATADQTANAGVDFQNMTGVFDLAAGGASMEAQVSVLSIAGGKTLGATMQLQVTRVEVDCKPGDGQLACVGAAGAPCTVAFVDKCTDGFHTGVEKCDDGNLIEGDGCSSSCSVESGFECSGGTPFRPDVCDVPKASPAGLEFVRAKVRLVGISKQRFVSDRRLAFRRAVAKTLSVDLERVDIELVKDTGSRRLKEVGRRSQPVSIDAGFRAVVGVGYGQIYAVALRERSKKGIFGRLLDEELQADVSAVLLVEPFVVGADGITEAIATPAPATPEPETTPMPKEPFSLSSTQSILAMSISAFATLACASLCWRGLRRQIIRYLQARQKRRIAAAEELERRLEAEREAERQREMFELYGADAAAKSTEEEHLVYGTEDGKMPKKQRRLLVICLRQKIKGMALPLFNDFAIRAYNANKKPKDMLTVTEEELFNVLHERDADITKLQSRALWEDLQGGKGKDWRPDFVVICALAATNEVDKKLMRLFSLLDREGHKCRASIMRASLSGILAQGLLEAFLERATHDASEVPEDEGGYFVSLELLRAVVDDMLQEAASAEHNKSVRRVLGEVIEEGLAAKSKYDKAGILGKAGLIAEGVARDTKFLVQDAASDVAELAHDTKLLASDVKHKALLAASELDRMADKILPGIDQSSHLQSLLAESYQDYQQTARSKLNVQKELGFLQNPDAGQTTARLKGAKLAKFAKGEHGVETRIIEELAVAIEGLLEDMGGESASISRLESGASYASASSEEGETHVQELAPAAVAPSEKVVRGGTDETKCIDKASFKGRPKQIPLKPPRKLHKLLGAPVQVADQTAPIVATSSIVDRVNDSRAGTGRRQRATPASERGPSLSIRMQSTLNDA